MTPSRTQARAAAQRRRAGTEQTILDATEAMLEERSFHDINVEDVMTAAGLGRTAFYRYFPDLESVVTRLMGALVEQLRTASRSWLGVDEPSVQLRDALLHFAAVYRDHGRLMQAFLDVGAVAPDLKELWGGSLGELVGPIEARILALIGEGRVDIEYPIETVRALSVLTDRYLLDVYWAHADVPIERPAAVLAQIWTRALRLR